MLPEIADEPSLSLIGGAEFLRHGSQRPGHAVDSLDVGQLADSFRHLFHVGEGLRCAQAAR
jgi:hypothetical protein